jgi:hypothetical protein
MENENGELGTAEESRETRASPRTAEHTTEKKASCGGDGCEWQGKGLTPAPPP